MFKRFAVSQPAAALATIIFSLAFAGKANGNVLNNGWFTQPGPYGSQICYRGPASGWSAAAGWSQWAVVPYSYIGTELETGFLPRIRVRTNGGLWPPASLGNGIGQNFPTLNCATAKFWYNVVSGEVNGNLVLANPNAFMDSNAVLKPVSNNPGAWKQFTSISGIPVSGLYFEILSPPGIIPEVNYQLMDADVEPCAAPPAINDLSNSVTCAQPGCPAISFSNDPSDPYEVIQLKNVSGVAVGGPLHLFIEGLPTGRAVANPDGDYLGTPYVDLVSRSLAPGETVKVTIHFNSEPAGAIPMFLPKIVSGGF